MQPKVRKLRHLGMLALMLGLLTFGSERAIAFSDGWNLIEVNVCVGANENGVDVLVIYAKTGGALVTADPITVLAGSQFCANGNAFYAYLSGGVWTEVALYPGLK